MSDSNTVLDAEMNAHIPQLLKGKHMMQTLQRTQQG